MEQLSKQREKQAQEEKAALAAAQSRKMSTTGRKVSKVSSCGSLKDEHSSRKISSSSSDGGMPSSPTSKVAATTNLATINEANKQDKKVGALVQIRFTKYRTK